MYTKADTVVSGVLIQPIQPKNCGLKLKVVLKWKGNYDDYVENIRKVSMLASLKIEGSLKMEGS